VAPAWATLSDSWPQLPRRSLREQLGDRRAARRRPAPEQPWASMAWSASATPAVIAPLDSSHDLASAAATSPTASPSSG
jgi:hypothetical protein